jgi:uncharacterized glyoxalase superfamily protein PhnB
MHDDDDIDHVHGAGPRRHFFVALTNFLVDDVLRTAEYYRDVLGFEIEFVYGDPPFFGSVSRDDAVINFSLSEPPGRRNSVASAGPGNGVDATIVVTDVDEICEELQGRGANIIKAPESMDYGMREGHIEDMNGYRLALSAEMEM